MKPGTVLGHEGVGIVEEVGKGVRNFAPGDRVVIPSTIACGNCNHRRYLPMLVRLVRAGMVDPTAVLTRQGSILSAVEGYKAFDQRKDGWVKVQLLN